jgi:putative copper resistance protein D
VWRVRRRHPARPWPAARTAAFLLALAVIAVATQSVIAVYDDVLFSMHMIQHVLLIMVVPPLLVYGRPVTLLLHAAHNPLHTLVKRAVRSRVVRALTRPVTVTAAYAAVVAGTHTPPVMDLVVRDQAVHDAEHLLYLLSGYLFFLVVIGSEPIRWRVSLPGRFLLLLAAMQVDTVVGVVLMIAPGRAFPAYAHARRAFGPSPVTDLHHGGMIMWIGSDVIMTVLALVVSVAFIHGRRRAGAVGGWAERARHATVLRQLAGAGVPAPVLPPGRTIDDEAHLAAYNAYLAAIGGEPARGQPQG